MGLELSFGAFAAKSSRFPVLEHWEDLASMDVEVFALLFGPQVAQLEQLCYPKCHSDPSSGHWVSNCAGPAV